MMSRSAPHIVLLLVLFICLRGGLGSGSGAGEPKIRCRGVERQALLRIKHDLFVDPSWGDIDDLLSSWGEEEEKRECCQWIGIQCSNNSGRVIKLDLSRTTFHAYEYPYLKGNLSSSLVDLKHLSHLDLSNIDFGQFSSIPSSIGSLTKLRYLNLSSTSLGGETPPQLGNLSSLQFLDLRYNDALKIKSLNWVSRLSSLRVLDLSGTNMSLANDWVHVVTSLPRFLSKLLLSDCNLPDTVTPTYRSLVNSSEALEVLDLSRNPISPSIFQWLFYYNRSLVHLDLNSCWQHLGGPIPNGFKNMAALKYLDLSENFFQGIIPESFGNMISLTYLDLSQNQSRGSIPELFGNMVAIQYLSLSNNMLEGEIPKSIWKICTLRRFEAYNNGLSGELRFAQLNSSMSCDSFSLEYLELDQNKIMGSLPNFTLYPSLIELHLSSNQFSGISKSIGQLSKLVLMDISENSIQGVISEAHFAKLFKLTTLDLSANPNLVVKMQSDWIPPFQLLDIRLGSCKLGPLFPKWLRTQNSHYVELNISNSGISDYTPEWLWDFNPSLNLLDMSNNGIRGNIPDLKKRANLSWESYNTYPDIFLNSNHLQGYIPFFLLQASSLILFNNSFSQLNSLCNFTDEIPLAFLDVSYNQLSGELPDCWSQAKSLQILVLANNNLSGKVPISIGLLISINILHLGSNNFTGELPKSLMNCTRLVIFDIGENKLSGPIPTWMGTHLTELIIISLRSNHFSGSMPSELCQSMYLQLLDLSSNDLSGEISKCLGNITALKAIGSDRDPEKSYSGYKLVQGVPVSFDNEKLVLVWKGAISEFWNIGLLKSIDLSSNKLTGEIPRDITKLVGLISLNLSRNNLSGLIPQEIGHLKYLDVLDLSKNHFFGQIPSSLSQVDRLSVLDLSSNNLSGKIPTSTQLQTREASAFVGNPQLCGDPLPKKCPNEEKPSMSNGVTEDGHENELITKGFYISLTIGFVIGFWGLCGTLAFNKSLRYAYLKLLSDIGDWLHVTKEVHKRKLLRLIQS